MSITVEITDPKVIAILEPYNYSEQCQIVEKYVVLGDMIVRSAQIMTNEESLEKYFSPVTKDLKQTVENLNTTSKNLESKLPESVKSCLDGTIIQLKAQITLLETMQNDYSDQLKLVLPTLSKTAKKGALAAELILVDLQATYKDHIFEDVSGKSKYTDIIGKESDNCPPVLIEIKDYSNNVTSPEVEKFWRDMDERHAPVGCFISVHTPIATVTPNLSIVKHGKQLGIFIVSKEFGYQGHIYAYMIAIKFQDLLSRQIGEIGEEKISWIADILNNRLRRIKNEISTLQLVESNLQKLSKDISDQLDKIIDQVGTLKDKLEGIVETTFEDFSSESAELSIMS